MSEPATVIRIRVKCLPHLADCDFPVRLVAIDEDDALLTELKFTPLRAQDAARSVGRLLQHLMPRSDSDRLAATLRAAAIRVWATRN